MMHAREQTTKREWDEPVMPLPKLMQSESCKGEEKIKMFLAVSKLAYEREKRK